MSHLDSPTDQPPTDSGVDFIKSTLAALTVLLGVGTVAHLLPQKETFAPPVEPDGIAAASFNLDRKFWQIEEGRPFVHHVIGSGRAHMSAKGDKALVDSVSITGTNGEEAFARLTFSPSGRTLSDSLATKPQTFEAPDGTTAVSIQVECSHGKKLTVKIAPEVNKVGS